VIFSITISPEKEGLIILNLPACYIFLSDFLQKNVEEISGEYDKQGHYPKENSNQVPAHHFF